MINQGFILTAAEMRAAEEAVMECGVSVDTLMQRAGHGAAQWIWRTGGDRETLVLCGPGNNGGDGYVIARWLLERGVPVRVTALADPATDAAKQARSLYLGAVTSLAEAKPASQMVDCLFGTGLSRGLSKEVQTQLLSLAGAAQRRIAIDLPSGVDSDNGTLLSAVPDYDLTIALGALKPAHVLLPARPTMGEIVGVDIGITCHSAMRVLDKPALIAPFVTDHKYSRGLVVVVAGEMPGAAVLAARAAQRAGAGYVKVAAQGPVAELPPSIVQADTSDDAALANMLSDPRIAVVLIGCGLGRSEQARRRLDIALACGKPLVLDADALTLLGQDSTDVLKQLADPAILTPHGGEFSRISGDTSASKIDRTRALAAASRCVLINKGADSTIAEPGGECVVSMRSSTWLSTAGTGDVLAGISAARRAVDTDPFDAAKQAVWLHNRAAILAGPAFAPEELIIRLPAALAECL